MKWCVVDFYNIALVFNFEYAMQFTSYYTHLTLHYKHTPFITSCWYFHCLFIHKLCIISSNNIKEKGTKCTLNSFQRTPSWVGQLTHLKDGKPFRGTWAGSRSGSMGTSLNKAKYKVLHLG